MRYNWTGPLVVLVVAIGSQALSGWQHIASKSIASYLRVSTSPLEVVVVVYPLEALTSMVIVTPCCILLLITPTTGH